MYSTCLFYGPLAKNDTMESFPAGSRTRCSACSAVENILRTSTNLLRRRMDTRSDTIAPLSQRATSLPRLGLKFFEPVVNHDQLVGSASSNRPNHEEALVVQGHSVLCACWKRVISPS